MSNTCTVYLFQWLIFSVKHLYSIPVSLANTCTVYLFHWLIFGDKHLYSTCVPVSLAIRLVQYMTFFVYVSLAIIFGDKHLYSILVSFAFYFSTYWVHTSNFIHLHILPVAPLHYVSLSFVTDVVSIHRGITMQGGWVRFYGHTDFLGLYFIVTYCALEPLHWAASWQNQQNDCAPAKTQISLGICPVWSESSLGTQWVAKDLSFLHADSEDSDQTGRMPRLIWVFVGCTCHFVCFVMRRLRLLIYVIFFYEKSDVSMA